MIVPINGARILDWDSFHTEFQRVMGFPPFYGRNLNAWIDCMSDLDKSGSGMTTHHAAPESVLTLRIDNVDLLISQSPAQYEALVDSCAFVNWCRVERGEPPILAVAFARRL